MMTIEKINNLTEEELLKLTAGYREYAKHMNLPVHTTEQLREIVRRRHRILEANACDKLELERLKNSIKKYMYSVCPNDLKKEEELVNRIIRYTFYESRGIGFKDGVLVLKQYEDIVISTNDVFAWTVMDYGKVNEEHFLGHHKQAMILFTYDKYVPVIINVYKGIRPKFVDVIDKYLGKHDYKIMNPDIKYFSKLDSLRKYIKNDKELHEKSNEKLLFRLIDDIETEKIVHDTEQADWYYDECLREIPKYDYSKLVGPYNLLTPKMINDVFNLTEADFKRWDMARDRVKKTKRLNSKEWWQLQMFNVYRYAKERQDREKHREICNGDISSDRR